MLQSFMHLDFKLQWTILCPSRAPFYKYGQNPVILVADDVQADINPYNPPVLPPGLK